MPVAMLVMISPLGKKLVVIRYGRIKRGRAGGGFFCFFDSNNRHSQTKKKKKTKEQKADFEVMFVGEQYDRQVRMIPLLVDR